MLPHLVQSPRLRAVPGIYHAFPGKDPVPGRDARELFRRVFALPPEGLGTLRQVHSARVLEMTAADAGMPEGGGAREGDALFTTVRGTGVGVRTADCVPILLAHPDVPLVAAIHAGWRGLADGIVGEAVRAIAGRCGADAPGRLVAAAGPAARGCCYEIGGDVCDRLRSLPGSGRHIRRGRAADRWTADLPSLAAEALLAAGLRADRVEAVGPCTVCSGLFHSFRREKSLTGRQFSFIYII